MLGKGKCLAVKGVIMFCPKCGTKAIEGADFCQKCGARLIKNGPIRSVPVESSGSNAAPESTATVQQPVDTARPSAVQEAYDRLTITAASHPKIRQIDIIGDPKSTSALLSVCGTLNEYFYSQNKKTGELRASRWSIKWIFYLICAPILICEVLFLMSFFRGEYSSPLLPIVCLIGCFIWFPFAFLIQKEREEVTVHIDRTLGWEIKRPSKMPMIVSYVLNLVEIGLCIFALVFVFSNSGDTPYHDDSPLNIDEPEENVALTQAYANEAEGISFMYPEDWTVTTGAKEVVSIAAPEGMFGSYANMSVSKDVADDMLFHYTASDFEQEYLSVDHIQDISIVSLTDMTLGGLPARKLEFSAVYDGADLIYFQYFYNLNADAYVVSCTMRESSFDKYAPVFEAIMDSYTITPSPSTGASANGIQVNSMDKAQMLVEDWMEAHPIGPMAGVDTGAAANNVDSISAEYFVLELWEAPREFLGLVYVRKSDGNITFKQFDFDEAISIDDWYEEWARGQSSGSAGDITLVDPQDEESWINLYKDGSFSMQVNLYAGYGTLSGTYERLDTGYKCHIEEKSYSGFPSDSIEEFELAFCDSGVKYVGEEIGTITSGAVYQLDSDLR